MKKIVLLSILVVAGFAARAQFSLGVKAGINLANISNTTDGDMILGAQGGAMAQIRILNKFGIQTEALFSMQGVKTAAYNHRISYINIPLMFQYYVISGLCVEAGPQLGIMLSSKMGDVDIKNRTRTADFSLNLGLAYELEVTKLGFFGRYSLGLSDVRKNLGGSNGSNQVLQLGVYYRF